MKNLRLIKISLACILAVCISAFVVGCSNKVELKNWENTTQSVSYGTTFNLETTAEDTDGNLYEMTASVTDANGDAVSYEGAKFVVKSYDGYTVNYSVKIGKKDFEKTVTITVTAPAPVITTAVASKYYVGGTYSIPTCTVADYEDGEIKDYTVEMFLITENGEQKQEYNVADMTFTPATAGSYYFIYRAVNSAGVEGIAKLEFEVEDLAKYLPYVVKANDEEQITRIYHESNSSRVSVVSTDSGLFETYSGNYDGSAARFTAQHAYNGEYRVKNVYPKETLDQVKKSYTHVTLWWAFDLVELENQNGEIYLLNKNTSTGLEYQCFFGKANALKTYYTAQGKTWRKISISIDDYIALVEETDYQYFILFGLANRGTQISDTQSAIFIGDIFFDNVVAESFIVNQDNYSYYNYNGYSNSNYVNYLPLGSSELETLSGDYTGNAVKMKVAAGHGGQYRITNNYTKAQLESVKNQYKYVTIYWAFSITPTAGNSSCYLNFLPETSGNSILLKGGILGMKNDSSETNKAWQKTTISFEDYLALLEENDYQYAVLFRTGDVNTIDVPNSALYLGNIIFSKTEDPNAPNEPTPAPIVQDVDQDNGDHIQYWQ